MNCIRKKNEPRTVGRLYRAGDAITIKYKIIIAPLCVKIKGVTV